MTMSPRRVVVELLAKQGANLVTDRTRTRGFLKDILVHYPRETTALLTALEWGIAQELLTPKPTAHASFRLENMSQLLANSSGLPIGTSRWAVETWALALQIDSDSELEAELPEERSAYDLRVGSSPLATHQNLADAVAAATSGATIIIESGVYGESLVVSTELTLVGKGAADSIILEGTEDPALIWDADSGSLTGVHLRSTSSAVPALKVVRGMPRIEGCQFSGPGKGVLIVGQARPSLVHNTIRTADIAVEFREDANGNMTGNTCRGQHEDACVIRGTSHPRLAQNYIQDGERHGIVLAGATTAHLERNTITNMGGTGIVVTGRANPTSTATVIKNGNGDGILITDDARGQIADTCVTGNEGNGVRVCGRAEPTFSRLTSSENHKAGVWVTEQAGGIWRQCTVEANGRSGLAIATTGMPHITQSRCRSNRDSGAHFYNGSRGLVEQSVFEDNHTSGLAISNGANPLINTNALRGNHEAGLKVYQHGRGEIIGGVIEENRGPGLTIFADGAPHVEGVIIRRNDGYGVQTDQSAAGEVVGCHLEHNTAGDWLMLNGARTKRLENQHHRRDKG